MFLVFSFASDKSSRLSAFCNARRSRSERVDERAGVSGQGRNDVDAAVAFAASILPPPSFSWLSSSRSPSFPVVDVVRREPVRGGHRGEIQDPEDARQVRERGSFVAEDFRRSRSAVSSLLSLISTSSVLRLPCLFLLFHLDSPLLHLVSRSLLRTKETEKSMQKEKTRT